MRRLPILITSCCLVLAVPALAQNAAQNAPESASPSAETGTATDDWGDAPIIVTAHFPGPALWRVKKGDSEVYIVGGLPVMEKRLEWDRGRVGRVLDRSNVFLVSPKARGGLFGFAAWQMTKGNGLFKSLYDVLPGDLGGRFWRIATKNGLDPKKYAKDSPVFAVMRLRDDVYEKQGLSTNDPEKMLIFMARDRHTPMKPVATYSAAGMIGKLNDMSKDDKLRCVGATLSEIEFATGHAQAASQAWATGDLNAARANSPNSATLACLEGTGSTRALLDRATGDSVAAINEALSKPGKSVVTFPLSVLLRPGGALDQLKAQGAEVSEPEM